MMRGKKSKVCCGLAAKLGRAGTAALDGELRTTGHRSFRVIAGELAATLGTEVTHTAVRRHKQGCLGLGVPLEHVPDATVDTSDLPPVFVRPAAESRPGAVPERVPGGTEYAEQRVEQDVEQPAPDLAPRARVLGAGNPSGVREDRILAIVAKVADGSLCPADLGRWGDEWQVSDATLRQMVREAYLHARVDRGSVDERRILAMGKWEDQIARCDEALAKDGLSAMDEALLLRERKGAIEGWCKAAGVFDDANKVQVNVVGHPVFDGLLKAVMLALKDEPAARRKVQAALRQRAELLRQPSPAALAAGSIETTGEAA